MQRSSTHRIHISIQTLSVPLTKEEKRKKKKIQNEQTEKKPKQINHSSTIQREWLNVTVEYHGTRICKTTDWVSAEVREHKR